ncbi:hypothetical protein GCM10009836_31980 [Pseudonocardia ailaonensis]|uniref:Uncharacterized protein n=1 Tax=Pseudonocardia ailaonensis TaxID=367279 RepID=A0ABN2N2Z2_9PSEU
MALVSHSSAVFGVRVSSVVILESSVECGPRGTWATCGRGPGVADVPLGRRVGACRRARAERGVGWPGRGTGGRSGLAPDAGARARVVNVCFGLRKVPTRGWWEADPRGGLPTRAGG